ncbi:GYDIA family GHMP kinase [Maribacter sp. 2304DJ31-5]|uniref:GYDIA family GHMP kinase n=1 Tax=Maribacter sp. 2304DJ31-5 TaxID=3386273 RepID=UPI0039BC24F7
MAKQFYSNGKLLLTAEYAILDGAEGLAVPTKFGQNLKIEEGTSGTLHWISKDEQGQNWFEGNYHLNTFSEITSSDRDVSKNLIDIFLRTKELNPNFLKNSTGKKVTTELSFPRKWGLGTSSTLVNNIAQWAEVNPFELLQKTFGGSGYDIACAQHNGPILFHLKKERPYVRKIEFKPSFARSLFFVYLNQKQNSRAAIAHYQNLGLDKEKLISKLNGLTLQILNCDDLSDFELLLSQHEQVLSNVLQTPPVKERLFPDYPGAIKSLGAWGGDFVLATGNENTPGFFRKKGYSTVIPYMDMVL